MEINPYESPAPIEEPKPEKKRFSGMFVIQISAGTLLVGWGIASVMIGMGLNNEKTIITGMVVTLVGIMMGSTAKP